MVILDLYHHGSGLPALEFYKMNYSVCIFFFFFGPGIFCSDA